MKKQLFLVRLLMQGRYYVLANDFNDAEQKIIQLFAIKEYPEPTIVEIEKHDYVE